MRWLRQIRSRGQMNEDLAEEIALHLEEKISTLVATGLSREDAERRARQEFGNVSLIREHSREAWQWPSVESVIADLRDAVRQIRKRPMMAFIIVVTFGLGIGASTATFSVADAFLFRPLGLPGSEHLVTIKETQGGSHDTRYASYGDFAAWQQQSQSFSEMSARTWATLNLNGAGDPERLSAARVSTNFFALAGVEPSMGRAFVPAEGTAGNDHEVILGFSLWQHRFAANPGIVGQHITLNQEAYTVVGVMPKGFHFPQAVDLWQPLGLTDVERADFATHNYVVYGRLKQGTSRLSAEAELRGIASRLAQQHPSTNTNVAASVEPIANSLNGDLTAAYTRMMLASTFFVLLVVCANVANLSLARVLASRHEIAVRIVLGARRGRIVRQILTESALLGLLGAIVGIALAAADLHLILISMPAEIARYLYSWDRIGLNLPVLGAAIVVAILSGIVAGVMPALLATSNLSAGMAALSATRTTTDSRQTRRLRYGFAVVQVALALVLVSGAVLLVQGMRRMLTLQQDYSPKTLMTFSVDLPSSHYANEQQRSSFYTQVFARLAQIPGVAEVGTTTVLPYSNGDPEWREFSVENQPKAPGSFQSAQALTISPGYLQLMKIPLLRGRLLSRSDGQGTQQVVLVNERMAQRLWPDQDAIGHRVRLGEWGENASWATVVGVVGDVVNLWTDQSAQPTLYVPSTQHPAAATLFAIRINGKGVPAVVAPLIRRAFRDVDADLPVDELMTYERFLHNSLIGLTYVVVMMAAMGGITLLLGAMGIYGVLSSGVQEGMRDIGIRMALGADRALIRRRTLYSGARIFAAGAMLGLPCALFLAHLLASLFCGVSPNDLGTLAGTILLAGAAAVLASLFPALRASSIDPVRALRGE